MAFLRGIVAFFLVFSASIPVCGAEPSPSMKVIEVKVKGQQSLTEKQVLAVIRQRENEFLNLGVVNEDVRRIWGMGLFTDVKVQAEPMAGGVRLVYQVLERPLVKEFRFFGNKEIGDGTLKDKVTLKADETYDQGKVAESVKAIEALYKDKNYYAVQVSSDYKNSSDAGKIIVNFRVNEGIRMKIQKILVSGNKEFTANKIKGQMKDTKEATLFWGGSYDPQKIEGDLENVLKAYVREGFAKAKLEGYTLDEFGDHSKEVVRKITEFNEPAREIVLRFSVEEGRRYNFHALTLKGESVFSEKELLNLIESDDQKVFNKERLDADFQKVRGGYASKGYIYAGVNPSYVYDDERGEVSVSVDISEGSKA
ncbi:MAG: POTRA domain-containing protein, partial [candidate division FCPU426 bacterium]